MTGTAEYGPDNPRDWDPDDLMLKSRYAPHETGGALRIKRTGIPGPALMKLLKMKGTQLMVAIEKAIDQEKIAYARGLQIHDALIVKS